MKRILIISILLPILIAGCKEISTIPDNKLTDDIQKPNIENTGPSGDYSIELGDGIADFRITEDNTIYENFIRNGQILIQANNVVLRNFSLNGHQGAGENAEDYSYYGIKIDSGYSGIVIEDGEIFNTRSSAILGMGFTARRLNIFHNGSDGIKPQGTIMV